MACVGFKLANADLATAHKIITQLSFVSSSSLCGGSVTAFCLLCCVVRCHLRLALVENVFPHSLQSNVVSVSNSWAAAHFPRISFIPESPLIYYRLDLFRHQFLFSLIAYILEKNSAHCVNFFSKLFRIAKSPQKLTQLALITTCFTN